MVFSNPLNVEIPMLILSFTSLLSDTVTTNLLIYRTCYVNLNYNKTECALLGTEDSSNATQELEKLVQPHTTVISMSMHLTNAIISGLLCLFTGPWSDKHGRKPVLLFTLFGFVISHILVALVSGITSASSWYVLLTCVGVLFGGMPSFLSACLSYITDGSVGVDTGYRMGLLELTMTVGASIGMVCTSYIFNAIGYTAVYLICAACMFLGFLYTQFFIPEIRSIEITQVSNCEKNTSNPFTIQCIRETVITIFKRREHHSRIVLLTSMGLLTLIVMASSDNSLMFMYVRQKLNWSLRKFTLFSSITNVAGILGTLFFVYVLHKMMKIADTAVLLLGLCSMIIGSLLYGIAKSDWYIYAGGAFKFFGGAMTPMGRCVVSKTVGSDEAGKIFSAIVALQMISGLISSPIYTWTYNSTIYSYSGVFNLLTVGFYAIGAIFTVIIIILRRKQDGGDDYGHLRAAKTSAAADVN